MLTTKQIIFSLLGATTIAGGGIGTTYYFTKNKTIKDILNKQMINLINNEDEYEVSYVENKGDGKLLRILKGLEPNSNAKVGGDALKIWCEKTLNLDYLKNRDKLPSLEKYCSKPSLNIEERYSKLNKKLIQEGKWNNKAKELKTLIGTDLELKADLGSENFENDDNHKKLEQALKSWCNQNIKKPLAQDKEDKIWKKVEARCLENKAS